jgi:hypothetical protein
MSVRIGFELPDRGSAVEGASHHQETFNDIATASGWITMHVPEPERPGIKMWIDGLPITGATLAAFIRPVALPGEYPEPF